jgi:hypothetical protein
LNIDRESLPNDPAPTLKLCCPGALELAATIQAAALAAMRTFRQVVRILLLPCQKITPPPRFYGLSGKSVKRWVAKQDSLEGRIGGGSGEASPGAFGLLPGSRGELPTRKNLAGDVGSGLRTPTEPSNEASTADGRKRAF